MASIPRPEYPRPQFVRKEWMNLNGEWEFEIDYADTGKERGLCEKSLKDRIIVPFCPELAAGLGCPRPPIELVAGAAPGAPVRVLRVDRRGDATDALRAACEAQADALARTGGVDGFILKSRSPSCGLASPLHDEAGREIGAAPGLWAALARERFPDADFQDETDASPARRRP